MSIQGQVIYEMHVGTFTPARTWAAAMRELGELARLGVTCVEIMPIGEFPGQFGWGYDGVDLFAPTHLYGEPDDLRRFVDHAHGHGLAVILDVVYNHLGPDGNYLKHFSPDYFTDRHQTDWGGAQLRRAGLGARARILPRQCAGVDRGIPLRRPPPRRDPEHIRRLPEHLLAALAREVRAAARGRAAIIVAENEPQHTRLVRPPERGGYGLDALWNDDLHHSAVVALTGKNEAYYTDYNGTPQEFISAAKWGYLYQGQRYKWQRGRRGTPALDLPPAVFVNFIENHDQVANSAHGHRLHQMTSPGRYRAMTAYLLLAPGTPMLFQGQEFASSAPFHFFADHQGSSGRRCAKDGPRSSPSSRASPRPR